MFLFCSRNTWLTNAAVFPDSRHVQGRGIVCVLIVLEVITFMVWVNLFLKVASLYYVPFSLILFWYLRPNRKDVAFGEQTMIIYCNFCFHVIISIDISYWYKKCRYSTCILIKDI